MIWVYLFYVVTLVEAGLPLGWDSVSEERHIDHRQTFLSCPVFFSWCRLMVVRLESLTSMWCFGTRIPFLLRRTVKFSIGLCLTLTGCCDLCCIGPKKQSDSLCATNLESFFAAWFHRVHWKISLFCPRFFDVLCVKEQVFSERARYQRQEKNKTVCRDSSMERFSR